MDGVVAAVLGADRPRGPGVLGAGGERVVRALPVDLADRVDRGQVDDVEAHRGDGLETLGRGAERPGDHLAGPGVDVRPLRPGEELVPAAEERALSVGDEPVGAVGGDQVAQRVPVEDLVDRGGDGGGVAHGVRAVGVVDRLHGVLEDGPLLGLLGETGGGPLQEQRTLLEHQLDVDAGGDLDLGVVPPGGDRVAPRLDLERPRAGGVRSHLGGPQVHPLGVLVHPHPGPSPPFRVGEHDVRVEGVVTLAEDQCADGERLADCCLRRVLATGDDGGDVHDGNSADHGPNIPSSPVGETPSSEPLLTARDRRRPLPPRRAAGA